MFHIGWPSTAGILGLLLLASQVAGQVTVTSEARLFGLKGSGSSFVYVFDRSGSMSGDLLAAAKVELLKSLHGLTRVQQFQIIFYNERARSIQPPQLSFADDNGLRQAEAFISRVTAAGGTDHLQALLMALKMKPDAVFFLTDADDPQFTAKELDEIWRRNEGTVINVIEFKSGAQKGDGGALQKLAEQNRGEYKYVDVTAIVEE
jgi:hypothetical protein